MNLSDKIMFDWLYPVCMFPAWITDKHPRKWVRFVGVLASIPWSFLCLPITFLGVLVCLPLMIWEDS